MDRGTPPVDATPALPDEVYLGTYHNDFYGEIDVAQSDAGLVLRTEPKPLGFPLTYHDRDTFSWRPPGENATARSGLSFNVGPGGADPQFGDEYLVSGGLGILVRVEAGER